MKLHKATVYYWANYHYDEEVIKQGFYSLIENDKYYFATVFQDGSSKEIEWNDDIDINQIGATREKFEKYIEEEQDER